VFVFVFVFVFVLVLVLVLVFVLVFAAGALFGGGRCRAGRKRRHATCAGHLSRRFGVAIHVRDLSARHWALKGEGPMAGRQAGGQDVRNSR
jgi:hypothetical protein